MDIRPAVGLQPISIFLMRQVYTTDHGCEGYCQGGQRGSRFRETSAICGYPGQARLLITCDLENRLTAKIIQFILVFSPIQYRMLLRNFDRVMIAP